MLDREDFHFSILRGTAHEPKAYRIPMLAGRLGTWRIAVEREPFAPDELADRYGQLAPVWSTILSRWGMSLAYAGLAKHLVALQSGAFQPGARVLDCGAGTGTLSLAIARASPVRLRHDLLDLSAPMLRAARRALASHNVKATLVPADMRKLPYGDATFDLVTVGHVIEHFADPRPVLGEVRRITKPGGHVLLLVTRRGAIGFFLQILWRVRLATPEQLVHWLAASGWTDARFLPLGGAWWCKHMSLACIARKQGEHSPRGEP